MASKYGFVATPDQQDRLRALKQAYLRRQQEATARRRKVMSAGSEQRAQRNPYGLGNAAPESPKYRS